MQEIRGNLWDYPANAVCVTTNGERRKNGFAIMGKGVALQARERFPGVERRLGYLLTNHGNQPMTILAYPAPDDFNLRWLVSFPTKHHWKRPADPDLIVQSAIKLVALTDKFGWEKVVLPKPGCGEGGLEWDEVKPLIEPILDDRFVVIDY